MRDNYRLMTQIWFHDKTFFFTVKPSPLRQMKKTPICLISATHIIYLCYFNSYWHSEMKPLFESMPWSETLNVTLRPFAFHFPHFPQSFSNRIHHIYPWNIAKDMAHSIAKHSFHRLLFVLNSRRFSKCMLRLCCNKDFWMSPLRILFHLIHRAKLLIHHNVLLSLLSLLYYFIGTYK